MAEETMEVHPPGNTQYRIRVINPWNPQKEMYMGHFYHGWRDREDHKFFETVSQEAAPISNWAHALAICNFVNGEVVKEDRPVGLYFVYPEIVTDE